MKAAISSRTLAQAVGPVEGVEVVVWNGEGPPGVLITPHIAGGTTAMLPRIAAPVREQLRRRVAGEPLLNVVNH